MEKQKKKQSPGYNKAFPSNLRKLIASSGKTQRGLAAHLHKSAQAISYYCDGTSSPDWETIVQIANYFSVSTDYLLGLTPDDTPDQTVKSVCLYTGLSSLTVNFLHHETVENRATVSFYRKMFDSIVKSGDDGLDDVPVHVFDAARAHVISENAKQARLNSEIGSGQPSNNTVLEVSHSSNMYLIPASEAEDYYLIAAQNEISKALANVIGELEEEVISALKRNGAETLYGFRWVTHDADERFVSWSPEDREEDEANGNDN